MIAQFCERYGTGRHTCYRLRKRGETPTETVVSPRRRVILVASRRVAIGNIFVWKRVPFSGNAHSIRKKKRRERAGPRCRSSSCPLCNDIQCNLSASMSRFASRVVPIPLPWFCREQARRWAQTQLQSARFLPRRQVSDGNSPNCPRYSLEKFPKCQNPHRVATSVTEAEPRNSRRT
ncbi:hypothetical protein R70211_02155 [Paraburkholderia domus]|uniref:Uncharacterized protein n=1 Tax=Paraburkholderia domus TaxID=2793075 RepID=A0A9N8MNJ6_9BURK|nr:hypothetical protein R70211_02155 [Paraburkholderia domus]